MRSEAMTDRPRLHVAGADEREATTMTVEAYKALNQRQRKYRNEPTVVDGFSFASKKEARRYGELKLMLVAGEIRALEVHPSWVLEVNGQRIGRFTADFAYETDAGYVVEDVKSTATKTTAYNLRKKLMLACHQIVIVEV
jgi:hypothetical protein